MGKVEGLPCVTILFFLDTQGRLHARNNQPPWGFLGGSDDKESSCNAGHPGLIPGLGRSVEGGNGNPLQDSCLENSMDRRVWRSTVHGVANGQTQLSH